MAQPTASELESKFGLTVESVFVPFSKSRSFDPAKHTGSFGSGSGKREYLKVSEASLNWRITLKKDGREVLTTDYSAGIAHCPSYRQNSRWTQDYHAIIEHEVEKGTQAQNLATFGLVTGRHQKPILPDSVSVIWSLLMDSAVLDYSGFEDWANNYGYDPDSRNAEKIYQACLGLALQLRNGLGDSTISKLNELLADY